MKKFIGLVLVLFLSSVMAAELPRISVETEVFSTVKADTAYIIFLVDGQGVSMAEALKACNDKISKLSDEIQKKFKNAQFKITTVNTGTKNFNSYRSEESRIEPSVSKIVLASIPADTNHAIEIMDIGIKQGITPFCANGDGIFGAVYYGVTQPETEENKLYPVAYEKLQKEAEKLAVLLKRRLVKMDNIYRDSSPFQCSSELRYKDIRFTLPVRYYSTDINNIKIPLTLQASFDVEEIK